MTPPRPLAHLELHTPDGSAARAFYGELLGWRPELIEAAERSYHALDLGKGLTGGIVECGTDRALWLPYVSVPDIVAMTERARELGAEVTLEPREGPAGWRSVVAVPGGGEIALWQSKGWRPGGEDPFARETKKIRHTIGEHEYTPASSQAYPMRESSARRSAASPHYRFD